MMAAVSLRRRSSACSTSRCTITTAGARRRSCRRRSASRTSTPPMCRSARGSSARWSTTRACSRRPRRSRPQAQGADRTMFSVHGSSGSNFVVLRMLALEHPDALVLVARNIHHSVVNALKAFGLDFRFLPAPYDARFEAVLPPSVEQIMGGFRRHPEALAVIYTSPTYEGLAANTADIVDGGARRLADGAGDRRRGVGRAPALPPRAAAVGDGGGRRPVRAVDAQARGRAAADRPDPLAHGARGLRADGGGLPRVRHDLAQLPPAGVVRRGGAGAGGRRRGGAGRVHRAHRARSRRRCGRALPRARPPRRRALAGGGARRTSPAATGSRRRSGSRASTCRATTSPRRSSSARSSSRRPACRR